MAQLSQGLLEPPPQALDGPLCLRAIDGAVVQGHAEPPAEVLHDVRHKLAAGVAPDRQGEAKSEEERLSSLQLTPTASSVGNGKAVRNLDVLSTTMSRYRLPWSEVTFMSWMFISRTPQG